MASSVVPLAGRQSPLSNADTADQALAALDTPVIMLDGRLTILLTNPAAEAFAGRAESQLLGRPLSRVLPDSETWLPAIELARDGGMKTSERGLRLRMPGEAAPRIVDISASPISDGTQRLVVSINETTVSRQVERRMGFLGAAQTVTGMAAVLAHEIKNPLSGIRGASQLLEGNIAETDKTLTELIRAEVDRICALVDRMTAFTGDGGVSISAVNIHEILDRVQQLAEAGFGRHVRFETDYDPSLPLVSGDGDLLIQAFLNLVKNAAEACPAKNGVIRISTGYRSGIGMVGPNDKVRRRLGVEVTVADNGLGLDPAIRDRLFEPFVSAKNQGSGLGLALTAKIISDLGGMIDCDSARREPSTAGCVFRTLLPISRCSAETGTPS